MLVTSNFFYSHSVFYLLEEISAIFIKFLIVVCNLFDFGRKQIYKYMYFLFYPFPKRPILDLSKLKEFTANIFNSMKMAECSPNG